MRTCHHCRNDIGDIREIGRRDTCPRCGADLHCCLNCQHYDPAYHNQCRETESERQVDKQVGNFCEHFGFRSGTRAEVKKDDARERLEALFRKAKP